MTKFARELDQNDTRTLGIITKPNVLHVGSANENACLGLARNEVTYFRLRCHVLRHRDFDSKHWNSEERDDAEQRFPFNGMWQNFPLHSLVVKSLRSELSDALEE